MESPADPLAAAAAIPAPVGRLISSDSLPVGGFTPGMVLAGRYRIIGLIGRGGMGEVYRADDLKLGQPVALKFLPKALADDSVRRERLFAEVRIARQVSHPNICRVYDISELEGRHFLTMEYIDGEDLASLLKRIGSLHGAKAVDVAQQLCAGLAAAHDKGVLHRDLKPANVMIDGRGRVRITDFGLAVAAGEEISEDDVSGTPPYMAPEQFTGKGASVRSDIYALGLVFYEVFTGKRAFEAKTLPELRVKKETSAPTAPSEIARDIDSIVERVILRCIEKDPRQRPASAAQVAAALPGGDPLAAAIAAGETPSPEMVAASGTTEGVRPWMAWACLAFVILAIGSTIALKRQFTLIERVPIESPPDALVAKARDILRTAGYPDSPADSDFGFTPNYDYLSMVQKNDRFSSRFNRLPALAVQFWYRQSPQPMVPQGSDAVPMGSSVLTATNPPLTIRGESVVWLDSRGNLTGLQVIPPPDAHMINAGEQPPDWSTLFKASGIDQAKCNRVEPDRAYLAYDDTTRAAWIGALPDRPDVSVRIEAAAREGKPVSWRLITPVPRGDEIPKSSSSAPTVRFTASLALTLILILGGAFFAQRNLRMGRGDRRGAVRLACFISASYAISWIFLAHHVAASGELGSFFSVPAIWFWDFGIVWLMYVALEPFVRRRWPGMLVGWSRLLAGSFRDPVVGRELLAGCGLGAAVSLGYYLSLTLASWFGAFQVLPATGTLANSDNPAASLGTTFFLLTGNRAIIGRALELMPNAIFISLLVGFLLFLVRVLLRKTWAAVAFVFLMVLTAVAPGRPPHFLILVLFLVAAIVFAIFRFGLLTSVATIFVFILLFLFPITVQSVWYSGIGFTGLAILLAFALYAFHTSLGGQPMFGRASLED